MLSRPKYVVDEDKERKMNFIARQTAGSPSSLTVSAFLLALLTAVVLTSTVRADVLWSGGGPNNFWSTGANWTPNLPQPGDRIMFGSNAHTNVLADFSSFPETDPQAYDQPALHLESLTFGAGAPSFTIELYSDGATSTIHNAKLEFDGAGVVNSSGQGQTFIIDDSFPSLFNYPPASSIVFNNGASAANASYHVAGGTTDIRPFGLGEGAARSSAGRVLFDDTATAGPAGGKAAAEGTDFDPSGAFLANLRSSP